MKRILMLFLAFLLIESSFGQKMQMPKIQLLLLVDASNSMLQTWQTKSKMDVFRTSLNAFFEKTAKYGEFQYGLRMFGHLYATAQSNCADSKLEVAFANETIPIIRQTVQKAQPKGISPVVFSLEQAEKDFTAQASKKIILLFTDGTDACNKSICAQYEKMKASGLYSAIYIVGLNISSDLDQFTCIDRFKNASTEVELNTVLTDVFNEIKPW